MRIVIADDHPLVRDAIARMLLQADPTLEVAEAQSFETLAREVAARPTQLLIADLNMPGMNGIDGLRRLRLDWPALAVVIVSGQDDPATIRAVLASGVAGFVPKSDPPALLVEAVRLVRAGGTYVPARSLADVRDGQLPNPAAGLTPRQLDVLHLLMDGHPNKTIARELALSEGTVKIHIAAILRTLHARNRTEAVVRARELKLGLGHAN